MSAGPDILLERVRAATADEYQIDREIGRGGMAAVFLARDIALERRVAIKVMLPDLMSVQGVQDRFVIEARTAAHLDHPGIVTVYAVKQRAGLLFIVMKFIEGHTLEAVLRSQGRLDPVAVALIGGRVAEALQFAHSEGVVHRDVKPSNIMIDPRGRPVVTDFGIARVMAAQSITVAGSMLGTPTHMSPEQCRGLPATAASDQYALGVTMYEMLTGRAPFVGSLFELITAHREQSPPPLSEFVGGVDPALEHTVMRMLAKDPQARWGSLTDVIQRLGTHTTARQGDETVRATLMLSGTVSRGVTPERGVAEVGLLTPPGSVVPPAGGSPLSPLPFQIDHRDSGLGTGDWERESGVAAPVSVRIAESTKDTEAPVAASSRRGIVIGAVGVAVLVVAAMVVVWAGRGESTAQPPTAQTDSVPPAVQTPPAVTPPAQSSSGPDSATRDSLARDSSAKALAAKDSVRADSVAKAAAAAALAARRDSATAPNPKAATDPNRTTTPPRRTTDGRRARTDSLGASRIRPESMTVQCARLLERQSLGERLTDAERAVLQRRCPK